PMEAKNTTLAERLSADGAWLRRLARELARGAQEAEDLCGDTVAAAVQADRSRVAAVEPWIAGIARRRAARLRRDAGRRERRERRAARPRSAARATRRVVRRARG